MAVLVDAYRAALQKEFCEDLSRARTAFNTTKPNLRAAVNAIDDWVVANQASFNTAIPLPARTELTVAQKTELLMRVLAKRFLTGA